MSVLHSRSMIVPVFAVSLALGGCSFFSFFKAVKAADSGVKADNERKAAPEFGLKDADGKTVRLSDYKGKVVLLDFWATWCGPCREALPHIKEIAKKFHDQPLVVISINLDKEEQKWREFVAKMPRDLPRKNKMPPAKQFVADVQDEVVASCAKFHGPGRVAKALDLLSPLPLQRKNRHHFCSHAAK